MTWDDWDLALKLLEKMETDELSKDEIIKVIKILLEDFIERGRD